MSDVSDDLREALRDLGYELAKTIGILWLVRRAGWPFKPWVQERIDRDVS